MNYWTKKMELSVAAREHTDDMEKRYGKEIAACAESSIVFGPAPVSGCDAGVQGTDATVMKEDSVSALFAQPKDSHCVVLNFASFKNPGGMFLNGSSAQEESLCHESYLFNVLVEKQDYYDWNKAHLNRGLYENRAILSPGVRFFHNGEERLADVLTCAAPNRSCIRYNRFTEDENLTALRARISFISAILRRKGYAPDAIVLGAFGCGVFAQDAEAVAGSFRTVRYPESARVIYAVPDDKNFAPSNRVFHP